LTCALKGPCNSSSTRSNRCDVFHRQCTAVPDDESPQHTHSTRNTLISIDRSIHPSIRSSIHLSISGSTQPFCAIHFADRQTDQPTDGQTDRWSRQTFRHISRLRSPEADSDAAKNNGRKPKSLKMSEVKVAVETLWSLWWER